MDDGDEVSPTDGDPTWGRSPQGGRNRRCGSRVVLLKRNPLRIAWTVLVTILLVYTGTVFLFRMCFIDFRIEVPGGVDAYQPDMADWDSFALFVTIAFWIDLLVNFAFSFDDELGNEVDDFRRCATHYLKSDFPVNFIACIPEELIQVLISGASSSYPEGLHEGVRAVRLQRMSRLARLMRLFRLAKMKSQKKSHLYRWLQGQKGIRVINLALGLTWAVHILACGWYLCAALHDDPQKTWVARRFVDAEGTVSLLDTGPIDQWLHSMYFVMTVFTTVGFGDMSAVSMGEIVYCGFMMLVGAVVHSIIISEVINVVTSSDQINEFVTLQRDLIEAFATHTQLDEASEGSLKHWVESNARAWFSTRYDRAAMQELVMGDKMPRELLGALPSVLFAGKLLRNRFLLDSGGITGTPPRLPTLLALAVHRSRFVRGEVLYQVQDYPFSMFLVIRGTFAFVATPTKHGGSSIPIRHSLQKVAQREEPRTGHGGLRQALSFAKAPADDAAAPRIPRAGRSVYPYMLFSSGSYFGEAELLHTSSRRATARCESDTGEVLTLGKADFARLADQFPQFGHRWAERSMRRERFRVMKQAEFTQGVPYRSLAAETLQKWYRAVRRRRRDAALPQRCSTESSGDSANLVMRRLCSTMQQPTDLCSLKERQDHMRDQLGDLSKTVRELTQRVDLVLEESSLDHARNMDPC